MNIKSKIRMYVRKGYSQENAVNLAINDAQDLINVMDERLAKAFEFLTPEQVSEIVSFDPE